MTAEPDAMRLVPVEPTEAMLKAGRDAAQSANAHHVPWKDEARSVYVSMLAAAPAVQPAAGREEIARAVYDWVRDDAPVGLKMQMGPEIAAKLIDRLAALSQPGPASEGEV